MNEVKKCPKCGGDMEVGYLNNASRWIRGRSLLAIRTEGRIFAYKCQNCGYAELWGKGKVLSDE